MKSIVFKVIALVVLVLLLWGMLAITKKPVKEGETAMVGKTAEWKTYTSEKHAYSIEYPSTWRLEVIYNGDGINIISPEDQELLDRPYGHLEIQDKLHIFNVQVVPYNGTSTYPNEKRDEVVINGKPIEKITTYGPDSISTFTQQIRDNKRYIISFPENETTVKIFEGFKFTSPTTTAPQSTEATPVITSIVPTSGPIGTIVEIRGKNLSGFEGDLTAVFTTSDGQGVELWDTYGDYPKTGGNLIKVKVGPPCKKGETVYGAYSGIPSPCRYTAFDPGVYKVKVSAWGKDSNTVQFTVTN